jgi:hypothetical protein
MQMTLTKTSKTGLLTVAWVATLTAAVAAAIWVEGRLASSSFREKQWFQCTHVNMDIIRERMVQALTDHPDWISDVSVSLLVKNGYLPEWSEVFVCPADFQIDFNRPRVFGEEFRRNLQTASLVAANFTNASYRIEVCGGVATIRCRWHTNVTDYSYSITSTLDCPLRSGADAPVALEGQSERQPLR